jgi:hypothetical protein
MAATPNGSSKPSGIMIPMTSSAPPFRCQSVRQMGRRSNPCAFEGRGGNHYSERERIETAMALARGRGGAAHRLDRRNDALLLDIAPDSARRFLHHRPDGGDRLSDRIDRATRRSSGFTNFVKAGATAAA